MGVQLITTVLPLSNFIKSLPNIQDKQFYPCV